MKATAALEALQRRCAARRRAAADPEVNRGASLAIYVFLEPDLDDEQFAVRKVDWIAAELKMEIPTAARALRRLVARGYLERGKKIDRVWSYRLRLAS